MKSIYERSYGDFKALLSLLEGWRPIEKVRFLKPPLRSASSTSPAAVPTAATR
jgi:hypothetical protein